MRIVWRLNILLLTFIILSACSTWSESEKSESKNTKAAKINVRLGAAYLERKDILRAKQKFLYALKQAPQLPEVWYSMAYFFETTGNNDLAKQYFLKAIALAPYRGDVQNNYGTYLCRRGEYRAAIQHFLKAVHDTEYLDASSAYENAALCARKIPDIKLAIHYFNKALQEDQSRPTSLIELAELHYQIGKIKLAEYELKQFLQIAPPNVQSYFLAKKIEMMKTSNDEDENNH